MTVWQQCVSTFRRSQGDLISIDHIDPSVLQHMQLPPVLATFDETDTLISVYYFSNKDNEYYDSDSEVECVALPVFLPLVPLRRYGQSGAKTSDSSLTATTLEMLHWYAHSCWHIIDAWFLNTSPNCSPERYIFASAIAMWTRRLYTNKDALVYNLKIYSYLR